MALSVAWRGQGSAGSALIVEIVQLGLFGLAAAGVATVARFVSVRLVRSGPASRTEEATSSIARVASVWAAGGTLVGMVASGYLQVRGTMPWISFSDSTRHNYVLIGPSCAAVLALLGIGASDAWRRFK